MLELAAGKTSEVLIDKKNNFVIKKFVVLNKFQKLELRQSPYHCFLREVECLKRLQGHKNFPTIISYDDNDLTITMDYCGEEFPLDGTAKPELIDQVKPIVEKIKEANIKFINQSVQGEDVFPYNNVLLKNGVIKFIDYENSLPEKSQYNAYFSKHFIQTVRNQFNIEKFKLTFEDLILNGKLIDSKKYKPLRGTIDDMTHHWKFTTKKNSWNDYQKTEKNSVVLRIEKLNLRRYASKDKTLLDLGANQGEFCLKLSNDFRHVTAVEPFVKAPEMPSNMTWVKEGFKDFVAESNETYDVVFSFAMTIQVRDLEHLDEDEIAKGHYKLVSPDGVMIYETQKLDSSGRPPSRSDRNQKHVEKMLQSFRNYFGNEIESGEARSSGKREYYVFKKEA